MGQNLITESSGVVSTPSKLVKRHTRASTGAAAPYFTKGCRNALSKFAADHGSFFDFAFVFFACAISQFIGWFLRRTRTAGSLDSGSSGEVYLIGGEKRVVEVAFFKLVRDGWTTNEGDGTFSVRLEGDAHILPAIEYEILQMIGRIHPSNLARFILHQSVRKNNISL